MNIFRFLLLRLANKSGFAFFASILACLLFFTSCYNEDSTSVNDINKQTVMVFMPWTGNDAGSQGLYYNLQQNLDSIEYAIVANKGYSGRLLVFSSTSANASSLYEVTYKSGAISHTVIKTYQGSDYTTPAGIAQIINDVKDNAYALNYAMIIGGHGCGWTYADDWAQMQAKAKSPLSANNHSSAYPATRFFGSNTPGTYAIDVETLAQGIGQAGIKLQYLLFDNCYMANAETAYELRNATNWLIASTSEILAQGMPYVSMWPYLSSSTPSYQNITNTFLKFYSNYSTPCGSLSAIDCRQMDALANIMRNINSHYTLDESLIDSLQTLDGYNTSLFFDLSDYVEHVCPNATMLSDYEAQIKRTVPYAVATDTLYSYLYDHPVYIPVKKFSGMTFSDPSRNEVALKGKKNTSWWKATHQE